MKKILKDKPMTKEKALLLYREELEIIDGIYYSELGKIGEKRKERIENAEREYWENVKKSNEILPQLKQGVS